VKNDDGTYKSYGFNAQSWTYAALTYLTSRGLDIVDPTATTVDGFLNSPEVIEAMVEYVNFTKGDDRISPTSADMDAFGGSGAMFIDNSLAMTINGGWMRGQLVEAGCNYGTALAPGNHAQYLCAAGYTISSKCENPEAAWEVLKLLTGRECSEKKLEMDASVLPTIDALLEIKKEKSGPEDQGLLDALNYSVQPVGMRSRIGNPAATAFNRALERLMLTDDDPAQIFADAVTDVHDAVAEMDE